MAAPLKKAATASSVTVLAVEDGEGVGGEVKQGGLENVLDCNVSRRRPRPARAPQ